MKQEYFHDGLMKETADGCFLIGEKCKNCGRIMFPRGSICTNCLSEDMDDVLFGQEGTLFSHTITYAPSSHFKPPFAIGYIETPEGVRVFAPLCMEDKDDFSIGAEMELEFAELWQEEDVSKIAYRYKVKKHE